MSSVVYSPLCDKNSALYLAYLFSSVCNGERVVVDESKCGGRDAGADLGSRVNFGSGIACAYRDFCRSTLGQDGLGQVSDSIDDNVVAGSGYDVAVFRGARKIIGVSDSSIASDGGGLDSRGCDGEHEAINTEIGVVIAEGLEKKPVPGAFGKKPIVVVDTKGRNYERNRVNRDKRHARKLKKQAMQGKNWRSYKNDGAVDVPVLDCGGSSPAKDSGASGFWNSCSEDMRRQLIESKARMHVASNNKKAEEDERRVKQLQSPEQILRDAMRLVNFANEQAKAKNDSKVCGWAKTVAESYAETIAKSAPTSVESFESFVQSNSSITSVSIEAFNEIVKIKDEQLKVLDTQSKTLDELNKRIAELELIARSRSNITVKCGVLGKCGEKKSIGNVTTGVSNAKIAQRNTQVSGTIVANSERSAFEIAKSERIMSQEHFLKFGKQPGVFYDGKDVFC